MNWFTEKKNVAVSEMDSRCDHLEDGDIAAFRTSEEDSFGPVERYCMCAESAMIAVRGKFTGIAWKTIDAMLKRRKIGITTKA